MILQPVYSYEELNAMVSQPVYSQSTYLYTVQVQEESGWVSYIHVDDMEEALEWMENYVRYARIPSRVIENYENENILQEMYPNPFFNKINLNKIDFNWRKEGF